MKRSVEAVEGTVEMRERKLCEMERRSEWKSGIYENEMGCSVVGEMHCEISGPTTLESK